MCILLKLQYSKFDVSRLFCSNVIEEKPLGAGWVDPLVKEGLRNCVGGVNMKFNITSICSPMKDKFHFHGSAKWT